MSYTQFKLSSGEEIIAEVIDEPEGDDYNIVIRRAMIIHKVEDKQNIRYYSFRPWMTYQLDKDYLQLLNYNHIIGEAKPDELLLEQYMKALGFETKGDDVVARDAEELKALIKMVKSGMHDGDSADNNVISLFDRDKLH